jgi:hypothetical protein
VLYPLNPRRREERWRLFLLGSTKRLQSHPRDARCNSSRLSTTKRSGVAIAVARPNRPLRSMTVTYLEQRAGHEHLDPMRLGCCLQGMCASSTMLPARKARLVFTCYCYRLACNCWMASSAFIIFSVGVMPPIAAAILPRASQRTSCAQRARHADASIRLRLSKEGGRCISENADASAATRTACDYGVWGGSSR